MCTGLYRAHGTPVSTWSCTPCAQGVQKGSAFFYSTPFHYIKHLHSSYCLCCLVVAFSNSADRRSAARHKRTKERDNQFLFARHQPSGGLGQSSLTVGHVHHAAAKQPMIEASDDSEEEYDSQEDEHYEQDIEDGYVDEDDEEEGESSPSDHAIPGGRDVNHLPLIYWTKP